jgi:flagellar biosynthetic protein FliR
MLADSFTLLPMLEGLPKPEKWYQMVELGSWMFGNGLLVALPAVIALLIVNFTFGVMSRVAPQMNIIAIGFPFTMVLGLVVIWLTMTNLLPQFDRLLGETYLHLRSLVN